MITYVNTVLVSNDAAAVVSLDDIKAKTENEASDNAGKFIVDKVDEEKVRVGLVTNKNIEHVNYKTGEVKYMPIIRWSNAIQKSSIKSAVYGEYAEDVEDKITIDFTELQDDVLQLFAVGGKRVIVRLTFKDTPTRYRKWTESYEIVTAAGETKEKLAKKIAAKISKEYKRARVYAEANGSVVTLKAMKYTDDDAIDTLNWENQVRFNANVYFTDPAADGWESKNKFFPAGVKITKEPGKHYTANAKLVRDREAQSFGYMGILNRGECTWPIIKPDMNTKLDTHYDYLTLEFENNYRAADDIQRKTKESLEIYVPSINGVKAEIESALGITFETSFKD